MGRVPLAPVALLAGAYLAAAVPKPSVPAAAGLVALGAGLRGAAGAAVAGVAAGLVGEWARRPAAAAGGPSAGRPAVVVGRLERPWEATPDGWSAPLRVELLRQGGWTRAWRGRALVSIPHPGEDPPAGARLRLAGYPRRSAGAANRPHPEPGPWRMRVKSRHFVEHLPPGRWRPATVSAALRRGLRHAYRRQAASSPGLELTRALILGEGRALDPAVRRGLRRAGLAHLVAVSGLHVGLLAAGAWLLARPLPRAARWAPAAAATLAYLLVVGPRPALLRASGMALLAWLALALERPPGATRALVVALSLLVAADPRAISDLGFRLTAAATAGLLLSGPWLAARWPALPPPLARALAATAAAQLFTLPWAIPAFHLLAPLAPLWNLAAVPWTALCLAGCASWSLLAVAWPAAAQRLLPLLDLAAGPFGLAARAPPGPWLTIAIDLPFALCVALAAAAFVALGRPPLGPLAVGGALLAAGLAPVPVSDGPRLSLLDVGQGESILLRDGRTAALVDGGGWRRGGAGERLLLPVLAGEGIHRLDAVVISHADLDHCGGLLEIADYLRVREVWQSPGWARSSCAARLAARPGLRLRTLWRGERMRLGGWRLRALHPAAGARGGGNDRSLVLRAEAGGRCVLLTGDVEAAGEREMLRRLGREALRCGVLKVAHHGSRSSTSSAFLAAVAPRLALVSAGPGNPYGHPAVEVVERLARHGVPLLRTDRDGRIDLRPSPDALAVSTPGAPKG